MKVGVYGGGRMGAGIAHAFLLTGAEVVITEASEEAAEAAKERVAGSLAKAAQRQALPEGTAPEDLLARLSVSSDPTTLHDSTLIVEAVPEDPALKKTVLQTCSHEAPDAWLASNTSSLSVTELAADLPKPERLIGLHFFNPVPASDLVEIVVGRQTALELVERAQGWVKDLGKTAITVQDSPGFASSRLGVFLALEAMRMVEDGVASAADVDTAMTLGYKHPTGPLRTTDIVGLDVRLAIAEHLAKELGDRFEPPQILRDKVAAGELGRKSGQGFYEW
ncbi:3-hydroxyacyl-CoA dehydrogenase family protein [Branchiibius sp. NY16-3462-2]|uniref:3-hydroxyacyl-CoA dehydrogenase family protein n=1 Tax=Branchiibius sp. NY16-3462-2 TaxID=1807500 RepID=UPI00079664B5|nr:3-hydroxyacyl-CoA dehydrogenase family protein [Branchiibius sp. NY16-3462-2]KYH45122.1 3-hydroxybutyryl-CoA dehydrogenase [Branchiibius sp. NY16-3462-2]